MAPASRAQVDRDFGWPVVVKPSKQGSTVGLTVVKSGKEYDAGAVSLMGADAVHAIENPTPAASTPTNTVQPARPVPSQGPGIIAELIDRFLRYDGPPEQFLGDLAMSVGAGELEDRRLVRDHAQPFEAVEDHLDRGFGGPFAVGVLHPQQEVAAGVTGV